MHPVNAMVVQVLQYGPRMVVGSDGLIKEVFDNDDGHLALFRYGHCGNYG